MIPTAFRIRRNNRALVTDLPRLFRMRRSSRSRFLRRFSFLIAVLISSEFFVRHVEQRFLLHGGRNAWMRITTKDSNWPATPCLAVVQQVHCASLFTNGPRLSAALLLT